MRHFATVVREATVGQATGIIHAFLEGSGPSQQATGVVPFCVEMPMNKCEEIAAKAGTFVFGGVGASLLAAVKKGGCGTCLKGTDSVPGIGGTLSNLGIVGYAGCMPQ